MLPPALRGWALGRREGHADPDRLFAGARQSVRTRITSVAQVMVSGSDLRVVIVIALGQFRG
jgi:hypothetical protein